MNVIFNLSNDQRFKGLINQLIKCSNNQRIN